MILLLSTFITNKRRSFPYEKSKIRNYQRVEIFKYMLNSYRKLPFTEVYLFIKLEFIFR